MIKNTLQFNITDKMQQKSENNVKNHSPQHLEQSD